MTTPETCEECKQIHVNEPCGNKTINYLTTKLCPLHRAVPQLFEALKLISKCKRTESLPVEAVIKMMEAIFEVEGTGEEGETNDKS